MWYRRTITTVQHGLGERSFVGSTTGEFVTGPETLTEEELATNRADYGADVRGHPLDDSFHRERSAVFDRITVPFLSAGNWGGAGRHLRGNVEAFVRAASSQKWLEIHGREHWTEFTPTTESVCREGFSTTSSKASTTAGSANHQSCCASAPSTATSSTAPKTNGPSPAPTGPPGTSTPPAGVLAVDPPASATQASLAALDNPGITMTTPPMPADTEITGPVPATLYVSSTTTDADIFAVLRVFDPHGDEVVLQGAVDPHTPIGQGWLRASHRELDPTLSTPWRPWHTHTNPQPLTPARSTASTSRSGQPASSFPPATASG